MSFLRYWLIGALGCILLVCITNFIVDPMLFFRLPAKGKELYYPESQRYQVPGIARNYLFDGVIIGSSLSENFSTNQLKKHLGINFVNLSISGSTAKEQANILELALARGNVKHVLWMLNWESFAYAPEYIPPDVGWPQNIYDNPLLASFKYYLANGDMFKKSFKLLFSKKNMNWSVDMDTAWNWNKKFTFGCDSVMTSVTMRKSNPMYELAKKRLIKFSYSQISENIDKNLLRIIQGNPIIHFDLVLPPYSKWAYIKNNQFDNFFLEANLNFREKIQNDIQNISNVSLYDYQSDAQIILNANNYKDVTHFSQKISNQIIDEIVSFKARPLISNSDLLNVVERPGNCLN